MAQVRWGLGEDGADVVEPISVVGQRLQRLVVEGRQMRGGRGADGLDDIRTIIAQTPAHLRPGGWLLLEHGWDQAKAVQALLHTAGWTQVQSRKALGGIARCSGGQWPTVK